MAATTEISWTDRTWNPIVGCEMCSPGCAHCYAETMAKRLKAMALAKIAKGENPGRLRHYIEAIGDNGKWSGKLIPVPEALDDPLRWKKPQMVFVNSMSDLFHESVPFEFIDRVFDVIWRNNQHTFQILTKRPERMVEYIQERASKRSFGWTDIERTPFQPGDFIDYKDIIARNQCGYYLHMREADDARYICEHPKNESCGKDDSCHRCECPIFSTVDDRESLTKIGVEDDYDFDEEGYTDESEWMELHSRPLHALPSNVWLGFSVENQKTFEERSRIFRPLRWLTPYLTLFGSYEPLLGPINTHIKYYEDSENHETWSPLEGYEFQDGSQRWLVPYLNWVIVGCESGPKRRPMKQEWAESLLDQCQAAGVPFFMKQMEVDGQVTGDITKFPERLRVQQFPKAFSKECV